VPDLEMVEHRRMQLWVMTLLLFLSSITALGLIVFGVEVRLPPWLGPGRVAGSLIGLSVLFSAYAVDREIVLRRLTRQLIQERVLSASLKSRLDEAQTLLEAGKVLTAGLDLSDVLDTILHTALDLLDGQNGSIMLVQSSDELRTVCSSNRSAARGARVQFNQGIAGRVAATREPLLINGSIRWEHYRAGDTPPPVSAVSVPLVHRDELVGVLNVNAEPSRTYTEHDLRALAGFAHQAATAIVNAQLYASQRLSASQSAYRAMHDPLTRLPNRSLLVDRVSTSMTRYQDSIREVALLFLDLDDFKRINDSLGYGAGDRVLREVADKLRKGTRHGDTVARFGGDEFVVYLDPTTTDEDAGLAAQRLLRAIEEPMMVDGRELHFTASIGVVVQRPRETTAEDLVRDAYTALHAAKKTGKGRIARFEPSMREEAMQRLDLEDALRRAFREEELEVFYQPIVELPECRLRCLEALVRWNHPERGLVSPAGFLMAAERFGMMGSLDSWVLNRACVDLQLLEEQGLVDREALVSVNLSSPSLCEPELVSSVLRSVEATGLAPERVTLEITESFMLDHARDVTSGLKGLKAAGFHLALDDFGTGYSSLSGLRHVPVDMVKVDRLFIESVHRETGAGALVEGIVRLGAGLAFDVVAEGIEDPAQVDRLVELGCGLGQGFFLAKPSPLRELESVLQGLAARASAR
jgi:diguanylate cyclase (GGDEF)-like protein